MRHKRRLVAALAVLATLVPEPGAFAQMPRYGHRPYPVRRQMPIPAPVVASHSGAVLDIDAGAGRVVTLPGAAASVFAADPKVAEARPVSASSLFIFGVAPGRTTVAAMDGAGNAMAQYDVMVHPSAYGAIEAHATLTRLMPDSNLQVETRPGGMSVSGDTATPAEAERAMSIVRAYAAPAQTVDNRINVTGATQVNLRVRFVEVSRSITRQFGLNWQAMGNIGKFAISAATSYNQTNSSGVPSTLGLGLKGAVDINSVIDALASDQLVTVLAEPNLTAQSGETASFLAGGEFPIPVGQQNGQITIEFKQYGVALSFVPTVLSAGHISLRVRPEVSELSTQGAVQLAAGNSTIQIPALTVRRADTTVELGSGQSFAIGGLLQSNRTQTGGGVPGIGEMPVLGALFHSDSFQRSETELVIVITPYVVRPASDVRAIHGPDAATAQPASDLQRILFFRQLAGSGGPAPEIPGDVGFVVR